MPMFVHLAPARQVAHIRRVGIARGRRGVYCLPVVPDYQVAHQWSRELRRRGQRVLLAVYFALPGDEPVVVGHYNGPHRQCGAADAAKEVLRAPDAAGYEVIVERSILPAELRRVRTVSRVVGWRFMPKAHERRPCLCPYCSRGDINVQRQRRYDERLAHQRNSAR